MPDARQRRVVEVVAPVRVCDVGGWTDTWFAGHGDVCHLAVRPGVEVRASVFERTRGVPAIVVDVAATGERLALGSPDDDPPEHRLLAAAARELDVPRDVSVELAVSSAMPPGSATGTSAAVCVAILAALDRLTPGRMTASELASLAHRVETERLGLQSGVQDQVASAFGGVNHVEIGPYPTFRVARLPLATTTAAEVERRLVVVFLGRPHASSAVHERVIARLRREGERAEALEALRRAARRARDALTAGDLDAYGQALVDNTEAQAALDPSLVGADARRVIEVARSNGATGWKVNGAGGEGGSVSILCGPHAADRTRLEQWLAAERSYRVVPVMLARTGAADDAETLKCERSEQYRPTARAPARRAAMGVGRSPTGGTDMKAETVVFFHAHPDDEAIFTGGTIARLVARGHRAVLVVATGGELGVTEEGAPRLGERRRKETLEAAALLGIDRVELLGYLDSGVAGDPRNRARRSFAAADTSAVAARLAHLLTEEHASALVVYDEAGIYGHPDHVKVHAVGHAAVRRCGIDVVYDATVDREYLHFVETHLVVEAGGWQGELGLAASSIGVPTVAVTTTIDVGAHLDVKRAAMATHASQIPETASALRLTPEAFAAVYGYEWYVRHGPPGVLDALG